MIRTIGKGPICKRNVSGAVRPLPPDKGIIVTVMIVKKKYTPPKPVVEVVTDHFEKMAETIETTRKVEPDMVNHSPHYMLGNGLESIDVIEAALTPEEFIGWCKGNALKYQFRAGKKDPAKLIEDYDKTIFFINRATKKMKEVNHGD